ncbi:MAG: hypothetical protein U9Q22_00060 [Candidatus Altiarchaeota archaeon]|nr:hypothetical protein [Candidatus Altiarchaeota archaeon]
MKRVMILLTLIFLLNSVIAEEEIEITKTAVEKIKIGEILAVTIKVRNNLDESISIDLQETIGLAEPIDMPEIQAKVEPVIPKNKSSPIFWFPTYYKWKFRLEPDTEKSITYKIKPLNPGRFVIGPTKAYTPRGVYRSNPLVIVVKCNANKVCEGGLNENSINCPEDCPSGFEDAICNPVEDGVCDPDCPAGLDLDCIKSVCGDGRCEELKGEDHKNCPQDCPKPVICGDGTCEKEETYKNCPQDCPSGSRDNYCDSIADGICDPDCPPKVDPDCPGACGNRVCDYMEGENYIYCPKDCPSGSSDGYCDGLDDGVCDPDCNPKSDVDCKKTNPWTYISLFIVIIVIVFIVYRKLKR